LILCDVTPIFPISDVSELPTKAVNSNNTEWPNNVGYDKVKLENIMYSSEWSSGISIKLTQTAKRRSGNPNTKGSQ